MELTQRQLEIVELVHAHAPITGENLAEMLGLSRPTIRSDLAVLVMLGYIDAKPKVGYFPGKAVAPKSGTVPDLHEMRVKEIQSVPVVVRDTSTVHDAIVTLFLENVGSLLISDAEGTLVGIVSRKDLLKITLGNPNVQSMPVSLVMTRQPNIITVGPDDLVLDAARKMMHHQVDSLPVVQHVASADGRTRVEAIGRITKTSMTRLLVDLASGSK